MTDKKSVDEIADAWIWKHICYGGLEYIRSGETYQNCMMTFLAAHASRDDEVEQLKAENEVFRLDIMDLKLQLSGERDLRFEIQSKLETAEAKLASARGLIGKIEDLALNALGLCDTKKGFEIRMRDIQELSGKTYDELEALAQINCESKGEG